ncbi:ricin B-like lectin [Imleria badia]|nr:ricin B-like lectin [Imleria badia]
MSCIEPDVKYALINDKGGTCMDISGGDNRSIIGYGYHNGPNQKWIFHPVEDKNFHIKSAEGNKFLSIQGELKDGQAVVADTPYPFYAEDQPGVEYGIRLSPKTNYYLNVDLSDNGNPTPGTPVQLWGRWEGLNQVWKLKRVE